MSGYFSTQNKAIDSYFNDSGIYYFTLVITHISYKFGFSFKISETYNCPPNCNQCSSPLTCLACQPNANSQITSCSCSGGTCTVQTNPFLNLSLDGSADQVTDSSSGIIFETGIDTNFLLAGTGSDPIPAYQRGYYFTSTSYITSTNIILPYDYTMVFYIKHITPGILLTKNSLKISTSSTVSYLITSVITASFSALTNTN